MAEKRFVKGLFKDTGHIDQPEGSWRHAKNMVINQKEGSISNEGGTELSGHLGDDLYTGAQNDKVIGAIEVNDDKVILSPLDADCINVNVATPDEACFFCCKFKSTGSKACFFSINDIEPLIGKVTELSVIT